MNLMGCEMGKIKVKMNKPVHLGQAILDLGKIVMYEFHYDYMKLKFKDLHRSLPVGREQICRFLHNCML